MVLSAAERATSSGSTVTLTKGRTIYYPSYIEIILLACLQSMEKLHTAFSPRKHPHRVEVM